jgi:hypothetical protein
MAGGNAAPVRSTTPAHVVRYDAQAHQLLHTPGGGPRRASAPVSPRQDPAGPSRGQLESRDISQPGANATQVDALAATAGMRALASFGSFPLTLPSAMATTCGAAGGHEEPWASPGALVC